MRTQSLGEEIANSVSHGVGALGAALAAPVLIADAAGRGGSLAAASAATFASSAFLLYLASTLYHALLGGRAKRVLRVFDHCGIFLLIAGTYTPFAVCALGGGRGWALLALVWTIAVAGIVLRAANRTGSRKLLLPLYLSLGWVALAFIEPLAARLSPAGLAWLVAGGVAYTAGVAFYAAERVRFAHFVWHLFVLGGTACHVAAALV
jgi:hemolysin III